MKPTPFSTLLLSLCLGTSLAEAPSARLAARGSRLAAHSVGTVAVGASSGSRETGSRLSSAVPCHRLQRRELAPSTALMAQERRQQAAASESGSKLLRSKGRASAEGTPSAPVTVRGRVVARLYTPHAGLDPAARAALAMQRLAALDAPGTAQPAPGASDVTCRPRDHVVGVYLRDQLILVATPAEAATRGLTADALAERWARGLRVALGGGKEDATANSPGTVGPILPAPNPSGPNHAAPKPTGPNPPGPPSLKGRGESGSYSPFPSGKGAGGLGPGGLGPGGLGLPSVPRPAPPVPPLKLSEDRLIVGLGETRRVRIVGLGAGGVTAAEVRVDGAGKQGESAPPSIVEVRLAPAEQPDQGVLHVRGVAAGRTMVRVSVGERSAALGVQVMPFAARPRGAVMVGITGRPAPGAWVRRCAEARRAEGLELQPDASVRWGPATGKVDSLEPGETTRVALPVRVRAPGCLPFEGVVTVQVANRTPPSREAVALLYSNRPERVIACGSLFVSDLEPDAPVRLLYHHLNGTGQPFVFRVELLNGGAGAAEVQVIEGSAGPDLDPVLAGHRAALRYWQSWTGDVGSVIAVQPRTRLAIVAQRVPDGRTVSGILGLRPLTGGPLRVRVIAEEGFHRALARAAASDSGGMGSGAEMEQALAPADPEATSDRVYPSPRKELQARYRVGDPWTFIPVGKRAIAARGDAPVLDGNYGVLYDIGLRMENPTDQERKIDVALSPDAGDARGVFWIEGQLVEAPALSPPVDAVLASFRLAPGEVREVPIRTLPVAGSAYPARIVVRAKALPGTRAKPESATALR